MSFSDNATAREISELIPAARAARAAVRSPPLNPHEAAEEFHKSAVECRVMSSSAENIRNSIHLFASAQPSWVVTTDESPHLSTIWKAVESPLSDVSPNSADGVLPAFSKWAKKESSFFTC